MIVGLGLVLAGCAGTVYLAGANLASITNTDKTLTDHALSLYTGKDCTFANIFSDEEICKDKDAEEPVVAGPPLFCYETLGEISCYERPDPYANDQVPVVEPVMPSVAGGPSVLDSPEKIVKMETKE